MEFSRQTFGFTGVMQALASGGDVDERRCGRVYVQGLTDTNDTRTVMLFNKVAAPPDHLHFPQRLWSRFAHEVLFVDGSWRSVPVEQWAEFVREQIDLLVEAGFSREQAQHLYDEAQ